MTEDRPANAEIQAISECEKELCRFRELFAGSRFLSSERTSS